MKKLLSGILLLLAVLPALCQQTDRYQTDTQSPEAICNALLETISVKKGEPLNWERFHHMLLPSMEFIWTGQRNDTAMAVTITPKQFEERAQYSQHGFKEIALHRVVHHYGQIATVVETYKAFSPLKEAPERGINLYQMVFKENRWWLASLTWQAEEADNPLPAEYLPKN